MRRRASNRYVKSTPVLRVALQSSRIAAALLALATIATAAMLALLPGEPWLRAAGVLAAGACGIHALRRTASVGMRSIEAIELSADRRAIIADRSGQRIAATVQPESYVGALFTTLVLRCEGARRSRALAIWPDTMPADQRRRLRVLLRHGDRGSDQA
jgi:threonine dehydrogenase-like Zn-dependent dehydrogenase